MADNLLYYGDNLDILRRYVKDESVDLVYLDPPFNSNQDYNVLFKEHGGKKSAAQIQAFEDTWTWDEEAARSYQELVESGPGQVAKAMQSFRSMLGENDMLAYLSMMAPRLVELRRAIKSTGSLYLHCDSTASAHLRLLLDSIFSQTNFRNEIVWKRQSAHSDSRGYGCVHDSILFYVKSQEYLWNQLYQEYDPGYVEQYYRYKDNKGRRFMSGDLGAAGLQGGGYDYEWKGVKRIWRVPFDSMVRLDKEGHIFYTKNGIPRIKRYLDEAKGMPVQDVWADIESLRSWHDERLGYPTQKPEALLERIIIVSSNEGDIVLDPFCGCGTATVVAQKLNRKWIGIDITHLAITLIKHRLRDAFGKNVEYEVKGEPVSLPDAQELAKEDRYQFQFWALGLVGARPVEEKKGADQGIDGRLFFHDDVKGKTKQIILSVKSGGLKATDVRDLHGVIDREKAEIGVLLTLEEPSKPMRAEAASAGFYKSEYSQQNYPKLQILTIEELLNGKEIQYPPHQQVNKTFKKATKSLDKGGKQLILGDEE